MTCAHLLRLEVPFCGTYPNDVYRELKKEHRPNLPYDCPKELASLLKDCWNTNPSLRPSFWRFVEGWRDSDVEFQEGLLLSVSL